MSYADIKRKTAEAARGVGEVETHRCTALQCPCRATVRLESMGWACSTHAWAAAHLWPRITDALHHHRWLIDFIDDLQRIERDRDPKKPDWLSFATTFWEASDKFCVPARYEGYLSYLARMRGELAHRCGLGNRPHPRQPKTMEAPEARFPWREVT